MEKPAKYELILSEIDMIAEKVDLFHNDLQPIVYNTLIEALVDATPELGQLSQSEKLQEVSTTSEKGEDDIKEFGDIVLDFYLRYRLHSLNDMEFSAFVAYCYTKIAPADKRVDAIGEQHYVELCGIVDRKLPKRVSGTLHNAKNLPEYLIKRGTGMFELSEAGKEFVINLLKGDK